MAMIACNVWHVNSEMRVCSLSTCERRNTLVGQKEISEKMMSDGVGYVQMLLA